MRNLLAILVIVMVFLSACSPIETDSGVLFSETTAMQLEESSEELLQAMAESEAPQTTDVELTQTTYVEVRGPWQFSKEFVQNKWGYDFEMDQKPSFVENLLVIFMKKR